MLPYKRAQRVSHLLREEISDIIRLRLKDPRVGFLTITDVDVTADLKLARVYVSVLKAEEREETLAILDGARSFVRSELKKRLRMKVIPTVEFHLDTSPEYGDHIEKLLKEIRREEQ
jgi:ribosome-binding factor A